MKYTGVWIGILIIILTIPVSATAAANFVANRTTGTAPSTIQFTDTTTGIVSPTEWNWSFGDGTYSGDQNPVHEYLANLTYTVSLNVSNTTAFSIITKPGYIVLSLPPASGITNYVISAETGETYIQWRWRAVNTSATIPLIDIYLDDAQVPVQTNYSSTTYIANQIRAGERHNIALYSTEARLNGTVQLLAKGTTTTIKPAYEIYVLWAFCVALMILVLFIGEVMRLVLLSIFDIILCLFGVGISMNRGVMAYLFIGIAIITAIILLINGLPKLREEINWW